MTTSNDHQPSMVPLTLLAMVVALIALCMFQSSALLTLSYDLTPSSTSERVVATAETWHQWMQTLGPAEVTSYLAENLEALHEAPVVED